VQAGDDDERCRGEPLDGLVDGVDECLRCGGLVRGIPEQCEVATGDEGATGAGEHEHAHGRLVDRGGDGFGELRSGVEVERVEGPWPIEHDSADAVGGAVAHCGRGETHL
jgi:hypothetical protein